MDADAGDGPDVAQLCRTDGRMERDESDGGSDGGGEAMHGGDMQGELGVPGRRGPVKEQRVPADAVDLGHVYSTDTQH